MRAQQAARLAALVLPRGAPLARTCAQLPGTPGFSRPVQLWAALSGALLPCPPALSAARSLSTRAPQAEVINPKPDAQLDPPLRSPGALGGGGGSCGSAAPTMSNKLEQKAIDELDDMSIMVRGGRRALRPFHGAPDKGGRFCE